jgi:hypothetical protein
MEIRLGTIEDNSPEVDVSIDIQKSLTEREVIAIENAIAQINKYRSSKRLINIFYLNDEEIEGFFAGAFESLLANSISWRGNKDKDIENVYLHANRLLLNYLSSFRTYIDHSRAYLSKEYGKKSTQLNKFDKLLSFHFDNNFCYRFFYKLRNYAQHCGIPLDSVSFKSNYDRPNSEIKGHLQALFEPKNLLENYDSWGPLVTKDLTNSEEAFELRELRHTMKPIMYNIHFNFEKFTISKNKTSAKYLNVKTGYLKEGIKEPHVFYDIKTNPDGHITNFQLIPIPFTEIENILAH